MRIEKLESYSTSNDGYYWIRHPNNDDIVNKINEIIEYINNNVACYEVNPLEGILDGSNNT